MIFCYHYLSFSEKKENKYLSPFSLSLSDPRVPLVSGALGRSSFAWVRHRDSRESGGCYIPPTHLFPSTTSFHRFGESLKLFSGSYLIASSTTARAKAELP
jgi:hypothetical protein